MMTDLTVTILSGTLGLAALTIISLAALRGWSQWIELRRHELDRTPKDPGTGAMTTTVNRIDVADLKERVRKLEAIAAGVDL